MIQGLLKKVFKSREKFAADRLENPEQEKPFLEHLEDLRTMIFRIVVTLFVSLIGCFIFHKKLIAVIKAPLFFVDVPKVDGEEGEMVPLGVANELISIDPTGVFMMAIKVAFLAALTISFPFVVYYILQFVLPGLRDNEKKILAPAMGVGFGLFLMGVLFAYFVVVPRAMQFFYMFGIENGVTVQWTVEMYTKFAVRFILIFGICFELPVVVMSLVKLDILNYKFMAKRRGMAIIIIFFVAAIITPTHDALTLALLGAPMYILYEICIWMAFFIDRKDRRENPELYEAQDRIEAELEAEAESAEPVSWGGIKDGLFGGDDDDDDDDDPDPHGGGSGGGSGPSGGGDKGSGPGHDPDHDESWQDPHAEDPYNYDDPYRDDPYYSGRDDYDNKLHNPDKDGVEDEDHGGGTRLDAGSVSSTETEQTDDHQDDPYHDPYHHDHYHYDPYHGYHDGHDDYHQKLAELQAAEHAAHVAEHETSQVSESTESSDTPVGAALGDTTGIGAMQNNEASEVLDERIKRLETLILRMSEKIQYLEDHQDL